MENGVKHVSRESTSPVPESGAEARKPGDTAAISKSLSRSRRWRSRSARVINGRLRHTVSDALRRAPPRVVSRVSFYVLHTSSAYASAIAPNLPCGVRPDGLEDRCTGQPFMPTAPALSLERLILQTATARPPPPPGRAPGALRRYQDSLRGHCQIENPGSLVPLRYNLQRRAMHPRSLRCSSVKCRRYSRSSRLAHEAPHSPRCDAGLSPRTARKARTGNRDIGLLRLARSQYA